MAKALSLLHGHFVLPSRGWALLKRLPVSSTADIDEAFRMLDKMPPEEVLPLMADLVWAASHPSQRIHRFFLGTAERLPVSLWPHVEEKIRRQLSSHHREQGASLPWFPPSAPALVLVSLCHPSGHIREKAVQLSDRLDGRLEMALLMVRLNDWVAPVRDAAAARLPKRLEAFDPVTKITLLPLLTRLQECGRHQRHGLLAGWTRILATPFDENSWLAAWLGSTGRERKSYLEALKVLGHPPGGTIRRTLIESNDRGALHFLIREVMPALSREEKSNLILAVRKSRAVAVKREWLNHCVESCTPDETESVLKEALLDRSRGIRQFARFHLTGISQIDFTRFYQNSLENPGTEALALTGLSEVDPALGHREALLRLESGTPAVLKAAFGSLESESLGSHLDVMLDAANSDLPGVAKVVRKRMAEIRRLLGTEMLSRPEIWKKAGEPMRSFFIRQSPYFQKWDGLEFLLTRAADDSARDDLLPALMMWTRTERSSFSRLPSARREKLLAALEHGKLPPHDREALRFIIAHAE